AVARAAHDVRRQLGPGRLVLPPLRVEVVANELLVVGRRRATGAVRRRVPVPRGVRREGLVDEDEPTVEGAELELRVGEDETARERVRVRVPVEGEGHVLELLRERGAEGVR